MAGSLFSSIGKLGRAGRSLFDVIDEPGTPGGMARAAGSGGALPVNPAGGAPAGVFDTVPMPAAAGGGFMGRMKTPDRQGYSKLDRIADIGATMQDQMTGGDRASIYAKRAAGRVATGRADAQLSALNAQIDALYPDDPKMRFLLKANPDKATEHLLKMQEPVAVGADTRLVGTDGRTVVGALPHYTDAGGFAFDERSGSYGAQRPKSYAETLADSRLNLDTRRLDDLDIPHFQRADAASMMSAGAAARNAGTNAAAEARQAGGGPAVGGGGSLGGASTAQLLQWLKGGR